MTNAEAKKEAGCSGDSEIWVLNQKKEKMFIIRFLYLSYSTSDYLEVQQGKTK